MFWKTGFAATAAVMLAGCGDMLPSDEELDQSAAQFEQRESTRIRQKYLAEPSGTQFERDEDVDGSLTGRDYEAARAERRARDREHEEVEVSGEE